MECDVFMHENQKYFIHLGPWALGIGHELLETQFILSVALSVSLSLSATLSQLNIETINNNDKSESAIKFAWIFGSSQCMSTRFEYKTLEYEIIYFWLWVWKLENGDNPNSRTDPVHPNGELCDFGREK